MNRRGFLGALIGVSMAGIADPERLLWVPGARKIFIPPAPRVHYQVTGIYDGTIELSVTRIARIDILLPPFPPPGRSYLYTEDLEGLITQFGVVRTKSGVIELEEFQQPDLDAFSAVSTR